MISIVFLDLDGTIIGRMGVVPDCVFEAADRARLAGIRISVCTGRPGRGIAQKIAARLGPNTPHIFENGAVLAYDNGTTIQVTTLEDDAVLRVIKKARKEGLVLELYTSNGLYVERKTEVSEAHAKLIGVAALTGDLTEVVGKEPVIRAQWVVDQAGFEKVSGFAPGGSQLGVATSPGMPDTFFVSVNSKGVSKGAAVRKLCKSLHIEPEKAMAIGDSYGDISMLEAVGFPVTMADAPSELRERFPAVVPSVEDCGAAIALSEALT
jgi:Cof subfamily protein (haloacid dehalogenase superfamily)